MPWLVMAALLALALLSAALTWAALTSTPVAPVQVITTSASPSARGGPW